MYLQNDKLGRIKQEKKRELLLSVLDTVSLTGSGRQRGRERVERSRKKAPLVPSSRSSPTIHCMKIPRVSTEIV